MYFSFLLLRIVGIFLVCSLKLIYTLGFLIQTDTFCMELHQSVMQSFVPISPSVRYII